MNRLAEKTQQLKQQQRSGLVCYFTAGDPDYAQSLNLLQQLGAAGADIIEIGMPFSDPVADGEVIQAAHLRALAAGQNLAKTLLLVQQIREVDQTTPIVLMGYLNPIMQYGFEKFAQDCAGIVDGVLVVDLPVRSHLGLAEALAAQSVHCIRLSAPSTDDQKLAEIAQSASGFLYHVAENAVTGGELHLAPLIEKLQHIRPHFDIPVAVGFGIKNEQQVRAVAQHADLVVVGSVLVNCFFEHGVEATLTRVRGFAAALLD
ncbi:tryptophan synthase subunit alpha [Acinetobacter larvae]|uniref:Tryptophan synthase alpha chain n=1 Tax=Acinetobacter larvae TaxID=1789224 RepID=A0A1B2LYY2_9GAMM|nr:tryptophan synthase subunit alpha [Acinetobacter larvae]AOA58147.1 tryptophan synthase subunit alpha [Acinetobacter larvae]